jgi:hypothetical protein
LTHFFAQAARHTHLVLMRSHPVDVGLQVLRAQSALVRSIGKDDGKQH